MRGIRREVFYPHPRELVWRALTEPELLADWLMANDIVAEVGRSFTFRMPARVGFDGIIHCTVLEATPPSRLVYTWTAGNSRGGAQTVRWNLHAEGNGTRLVLEHTGFEGLFGVLLRAMMGYGWSRKLTKPAHFSRVLSRIALHTPR